MDFSSTPPPRSFQNLNQFRSIAPVRTMDPSPASPPAPESAVAPAATSSHSWSIYGRGEITQQYEILGRIGSGAYADVYRARRRSDGLEVALKEVHDYVSSLREIEALQSLSGAPNVVELLDFFWAEEEDAVLVLEFLPVDLDSVVRNARKAGGGGIPVGETKSWIIQILRGVEACHRNGVVHRDLKPSNLLISATGVLKLADFGQARILQDTQFQETWTCHHPENTSILSEPEHHYAQETKLEHEAKPAIEDEYLREMESLKAKNTLYDTDKETSLRDGDASCLATCSTGDVDDDPFKGYYPYEGEEGAVDESSSLTSCVGTRWFRAPELLYGSTSYGLEIDLWSLGCIVAELLRLEPLFPGTSDIDQIGRILSVLGDLTEETCPGCSKFPDFNKLFFNKVESPIGLEALFPNRPASEITLVRKLLCYNPANRATAAMLLHDSYFSTEPLPVDVNELTVPSTRDDQDESSQGELADFRDGGSDSDFDEFGNMDVSTTEKGFSIRFS